MTDQELILEYGLRVVKMKKPHIQRSYGLHVGQVELAMYARQRGRAPPNKECYHRHLQRGEQY